jgi:hypothetical protein
VSQTLAIKAERKHQQLQQKNIQRKTTSSQTKLNKPQRIAKTQIVPSRKKANQNSTTTIIDASEPTQPHLALQN